MNAKPALSLCTPEEMQDLLARIYELERQNVVMQEALRLALSMLRKMNAKADPDE
jgi:hypothetical protein